MLSAEFLDAARFPEVRWEVSDFEGDESRAITATGELTIHGHTQAGRRRRAGSACPAPAC